MKIVVIIPSRFGSTRFPGKPLHPITPKGQDPQTHSKPMIQWVYETAQTAHRVSSVFVATDDQRIVQAVEAFGGQVVMTSASNRSGTDRVGEAAAAIGLDPEDIIVNIQGDQPVFDARQIDQVVQPLLDDPALKMSTLAFKIIDPGEITNPKDCKVTFDHKGMALYFSRAPIPWDRDQNTPCDIYKHLGVYAYTKGFLDIFRRLPDGVLENIEKLEQLRALEYGHRIKVVITPFDSLEVDIPADIPRIEALL